MTDSLNVHLSQKGFVSASPSKGSFEWTQSSVPVSSLQNATLWTEVAVTGPCPSAGGLILAPLGVSSVLPPAAWVSRG